MVLSVIISNVIASFCEGMAIIVLIPLIQISSNNSTEDVSILITYLIKAIGLFNLKLNIPTIVGIFMFFTFLSAFANYISGYATGKFRIITERELKKELFYNLFSSNWLYLARNKTGYLIKSLLQDAHLAGFGFMYLLFATSYFITFVVLLLLAAILSFKMTLITLLFITISMPLYLIILKKGQKSGNSASDFAEKLGAEATEMLMNSKLLFCQGMRQMAKNRFSFFNLGWYTELVKQSNQNALIKFIFEFSAASFVATFLLITLWYQKQPIALTLVFLMVFYRLAPRLAQFQTALYQTAINSGWLETWQKLNEEAKANVCSQVGSLSPTFLREISFNNLTFCYPNTDEPVLNNVSLKLPAYSALAIIGSSGQGKSTILDLITGLITPKEGSIKIDDINLQDINLDKWQSHIGMVLQENPILNTSIAENIVFGYGEIDDKRLKDAAEFAGALDFINEMPEGFNTIAGERGSRLSGGQRQRIALARALYRKPWILLLDEVTSALDSISTEILIASLKKLKSKMTIILVTHDHRLLDMADQTIEIKEKNIINKNDL
ncbi:MAG: ABC transporter ATP-binding protein [Alphaproteobacteria bacterium]